MVAPNVLVLRSPGANCDGETRFAFEQAGARAELVHVNRLREQPGLLLNYQILAIPGGFSYGDDVAAGRILATQMSHFLGEMLRRFRDAEKLILGICNGYQALLQTGLLLQPDDDGPLATLAANAAGRFEDRWVYLSVAPGRCPFLTGLERLHVPIAHGEGRFVCREEWICRGLEETGQIVLRYADRAGRPGPYPVNPNGSQADIAGLCDATGRVLGLMPHPERHVLPTQDPQWPRHGLRPAETAAAVFRNAVAFFA